MKRKQGTVCLAILFFVVGIWILAYYQKAIFWEVEMAENVRKLFRYKNQNIEGSSESDNPNWVHQNYRKKLCDLDKASIDKLRQYNVSEDQVFNTTTDANHLYDFFQSFVLFPHQSFCKEMKRFGGYYRKDCKWLDGEKFICMDDIIKDIINGECLVYSFGIMDDFSFEDVLDELGCKVYTFDASVNHPEIRGKNMHFEKTFIGSENIENTQTLGTILARFGHMNEKISYLKLDIEGHELEVLPNALKEGLLTNVQQIGMEFHLKGNAKKTNHLIGILKKLYFEENFRLISYDVNACYKNMVNTPGKHYHLAEIVLRKITDYDNCV